MRNSDDFKAIEAALVGRSDEAVKAADEGSVRKMAGVAAVKVSGGFLRSARRLLLHRRAEARRKGRIEAIMPAVRQIWPKAEFADCSDYFRIYPDGMPGEPEIDGAQTKGAI